MILSVQKSIPISHKGGVPLGINDILERSIIGELRSCSSSNQNALRCIYRLVLPLQLVSSIELAVGFVLFSRSILCSPICRLGGTEYREFEDPDLYGQ